MIVDHANVHTQVLSLICKKLMLLE